MAFFSNLKTLTPASGNSKEDDFVLKLYGTNWYMECRDTLLWMTNATQLYRNNGIIKAKINFQHNPYQAAAQKTILEDEVDNEA